MLIGFVVLVAVILTAQWIVRRSAMGSTAKTLINAGLWCLVACGVAALYLAAGMPV